MYRCRVFVIYNRMPNATLDKVKNGFKGAIKRMTTGSIPVNSSTNVDSQITRSDMLKPDSEPAFGTADELVKLGNKRIETSRQAFTLHHRQQFFRGIAAYNGRNGQTWNAGADSMMPAGGGNTNPDEAERLCRVSVPIIQAKTDMFIARVMAAFPDAWAAPLTDSQGDKECAQISRAVISHCSKITKLQEVIEEAARIAAMSTNVYIEVCWNNHELATAGLPQPDGTVKYEELPLGEVAVSTLLAIDCYPDPNASLTGDINTGAYFGKRCIREVSWIKEKWGVTVEGTTYGESYTSLQRRLQYQAGDMPQGTADNKTATEVTEMWEKPIPGGRFPEGRFWVYTSDGTICYAGKWPYKNKKQYPFYKIGVKKNVGSVWDMNFVDQLLDIQKQKNSLSTYLFTRQQWDRPEKFIDVRSGIDVSDFSPVLGKVTGYDGTILQGAPVGHFTEPPPVDDFYIKRGEMLDAEADMISGVRDFNSDTVNAITSALDLEMRIEEDKSRSRSFEKRISNTVVDIYGAFIDLYEQYGCTAPRLLGIDDKQIPMGQGAAAGLADISALRRGKCRVVLSPGSGIAKTAAATEEFLEKFVGMALKGADPATLKFWLEQTQYIRSDASVDELLENYTQFYQAQQQQKMQIAQMQGQQQQSIAQQKLEQSKEEAAIQTQAEQDRQAMQVHGAAMEQSFRSQADQANENQRASNAAMLENLKFEHQMQIDSNSNLVPNVSWSLPLKPGPKMTNSAAKRMGLTPDDVSTLMKIVAPPKPQPVGSKNGNTSAK